MNNDGRILKLLEVHSKKNSLDIVALVVKDPRYMKTLMTLFFHGDLRTCQRVSWAVGILADNNTQLILPYFEKMINNLKDAKHDAIIRNTLRTWKSMDIPEKHEGKVYDICFDYLNDIQQPIAIRVFAMIVVSKIARKYPDLKEEVISTIEMFYEHGSAGFQSRARKELRNLRK
jgi:hypothetical protein